MLADHLFINNFPNKAIGLENMLNNRPRKRLFFYSKRNVEKITV